VVVDENDVGARPVKEGVGLPGRRRAADRLEAGL
jgi:hypothetical protein